MKPTGFEWTVLIGRPLMGRFTVSNDNIDCSGLGTVRYKGISFVVLFIEILFTLKVYSRFNHVVTGISSNHVDIYEDGV